MSSRRAARLAPMALVVWVGCGGRRDRTREVSVEHAPAPAPRPVCAEQIPPPPAGAIAVPPGREIKPGLHGLTLVYRREVDEPMPHAAVDFTQISCTVRTDRSPASPPHCSATPEKQRDHATPEGAWHAVADETGARIRSCFATSARAPSSGDLEHVQRIGTPWTSTDDTPRILLVRTAKTASVPELESYGCEGVHDVPCDRATRPTGRRMDATQHMDVAVYALDRRGLHPLRGAFAPTSVDLRLLYPVVEMKGAYGDRVVAPELDVPGFHPLDANYLNYDGSPARMACYYPALAARLNALAVDPADVGTRIAADYDLTVLSLLQRDPAGARDHLAQLHAALDSAPGDASSTVQPFVRERLAVLDALAAGQESIDDPCVPP